MLLNLLDRLRVLRLDIGATLKHREFHLQFLIYNLAHGWVQIECRWLHIKQRRFTGERHMDGDLRGGNIERTRSIKNQAIWVSAYIKLDFPLGRFDTGLVQGGDGNLKLLYELLNQPFLIPEVLLGKFTNCALEHFYLICNDVKDANAAEKEVRHSSL